jgi:hypothetical protein
LCRNFFTSLFYAKPQTPSEPIEPPRSEEKRVLKLPNRSPPVTTPEAPSKPTPKSQAQTRLDQNRSTVLFGAGAVFFAFSLLITRRSFARRRLAASPAFYTDAPANVQQQARKVSSAMEAVEALNIATINVLSLAMMSTGGLLWYFDINSMDDARRKLRGGLGVDGSGRDEKQAEQEFEEWMATVLSRKEAKEKGRVEDKRFNERGKER